MNRSLGPAALALIVAACVTAPPERAPLPPLEEVLEPPGGCVFLVGDPQGVLVEEVLTEAAANGILEPGDVIVAVDGEETPDTTALLAILSRRRPGDQIGVAYTREGVDRTSPLVLGESPDDPERAMIGILVDTRYGEVPYLEAADDVAAGPTIRPVAVGETIFLLDPVAVEWEPTGVEVEPDLGWVATADGIHTLDDDGMITDLLAGATVAHDRGDGWDPLRIIGSIGDDLVLTVTRPASAAEGAVAVGLSRFDPDSGDTSWTVPVPAGFGLPFSALAAPNQERMVVVGIDEAGTTVTGVDVVEGDGTFTTTAPSDLGTPVGWMGADVILYRTAADLATLYTVEDGSAEELTLDPEVTGVPLYPVGDERHLLAVSGRNLLRDDVTAEGGVRALAEDCFIARVGEPGWAA